MKKIALCACTYKRVDLLDELIHSLVKARDEFLERFKEDNFDVQIILVDNDPKMSAKAKVESFAQRFSFINYHTQQESGLVMARNKCLDLAVKGEYDYLTFVDDDEYVDNNWLFHMYTCLIETNSNIVFGRVEPVYPPECPEWVTKGKFFGKTQYPDRTFNIISATANVLIDMSIVRKEREYFDVSFNRTGGEDTYFFKRYVGKGYQSVWCQDAVVYDRVVQERLNTRYIYLRAYTASYTYSEIQQKLGEEIFLESLVKGIIKFGGSLLSYPFFLFGKKEKRVLILRNIYSGLGRTRLKKHSRY